MDESAPYRAAIRSLLIEVVRGRHRPAIYDTKVSGIGWRQERVDAENPRFISPNEVTLIVARLGLPTMKSPEWKMEDEHGRAIKRKAKKAEATGVSITMVRNEVLAQFNEEDEAAGRPWVTSVVFASLGKPMLSYFRDLERLREVRLRSNDERVAYHLDEYLRVLAFDWNTLPAA